jgi:hypothetical protein
MGARYCPLKQADSTDCICRFTGFLSAIEDDLSFLTDIL